MTRLMLMAAVALLMTGDPGYAQVAGKWATDATVGPRPWTLDLKVVDGTLPGNKLIGTMTQGGAPLELKDGSVFLGSEFAFTTQQGSVIIKNTGDVVGDELRLKQEHLGDGPPGFLRFRFKRVK